MIKKYRVMRTYLVSEVIEVEVDAPRTALQLSYQTDQGWRRVRTSGLQSTVFDDDGLIMLHIPSEGADLRRRLLS